MALIVKVFTRLFPLASSLIVVVCLTQHLYWADLAASVAIGVTVLEVFGIEGVYLCTGHNVIVEVAAIIV